MFNSMAISTQANAQRACWLPSLTFFWSQGRMPTNPHNAPELRIMGGPLPPPRARDHVSQGNSMPMHMTTCMPSSVCRNMATMSLWAASNVRLLCSASSSKSTKAVSTPLAAKLLATLPTPPYGFRQIPLFAPRKTWASLSGKCCVNLNMTVGKCGRQRQHLLQLLQPPQLQQPARLQQPALLQLFVLDDGLQVPAWQNPGENSCLHNAGWCHDPLPE